MHHARVDPSPTALRSPLSPWERVGILIFIPLQGERGNRKAVGEGSLSTPLDFDGALTEPSFTLHVSSPRHIIASLGFGAEGSPCLSTGGAKARHKRALAGCPCPKPAARRFPAEKQAILEHKRESIHQPGCAG
jgi:hypothetical protein